MGFPGTWMTMSESVVYRVVPKCACSTIGQIMYYSDHGEYFDGDIHDATSGMHKWAIEDSQAAHHRYRPEPEGLFLHLRAQPLHADPVVVLRQDLRHPAQRQALPRQPGAAAGAEIRHRGRRRGRQGRVRPDPLVPPLPALFARDTIRWRRPMDPDIHWSAMSGHVSTFIVNGGRYDHIFFTEKFNEGMQVVLDNIETEHGIAGRGAALQ
jgi:hypothetical protein